MIITIFSLYLGMSSVVSFIEAGTEIAYAANISSAAASPNSGDIETQASQFLAQAQGVYITFNNGHWPEIEYRYKVVFHDTEVILTDEQLISLKYQLEPINECMVRIVGSDFAGFAMCQKEGASSQEWVDACSQPQTTDST